jgi:hypothetical protein
VHRVISTIPLALAVGICAFGAVPTYNENIAPILYKNCAACHRPGEVAPFSLLTYQDAAKRASLIATVTEQRYMPPWKPVPGYGHFKDERRLTDDQIATIREWAKNGAPEGDPAKKPEPPVFTNGWQAGKPDTIFTLQDKFSVPADGPDVFRCFVVPMNLDHDVFAKSFEVRPGNPKVVHHVLIFTDVTGASKKLAGDAGYYPCFGGPGFAQAGLVGGWVPGDSPVVAPEGMASPIRKGTNLVVQIHYHPSGKPEVDQTSIGIGYGPPNTIAGELMLLSSWGIDIPPGDSHYVTKTSLTVPSDVEVIAIAPHSHYLGKDMKVTAHNPDGTTTPLIWIKDWDFNWQGSYRYVDPVKLVKGTKLELEVSYDNSTNNPRNPSNPPVRVRFGEQTTDEMAVCFLAVKLPAMSGLREFQREAGLEIFNQFLTTGSLETIPPELEPAKPLLQAGFQLFDKNKDGKLDEEERKAFLSFVRLQIR